MKLNSPRTNPYSHWQQVLESWHKKGFQQKLRVQDKQRALDDDGRAFRPQELTVLGLEHFLLAEAYLSDNLKEQPARSLLALRSDDGQLRLLEHDYSEPGAEVVKAFMTEVANGDFKNLYQG